MLAERGLAEALFAELNRQLDAKGLVLQAGMLIDATLVEAAVARPPQSEGEVSTKDPRLASRGAASAAFSASRLIEAWRSDYNRTRPHTSLNGLTPAAFANRPRIGANGEQALLMNGVTFGAGSHAAWEAEAGESQNSKKAAALAGNGLGRA